jgi:RNA recognition motif-containing protein
MTRILRINNLSDDTTVDDLRALFASMGTIAGVKISRHAETGESRGFGFVKMKTKDAARSALSALNGQTLRGRAIRVVAVRSAPGTRKPGDGRKPAQTP